MMNVSAQLKKGFDMLLKQNGSTILIHKSWGNPNQSTTETRGLKNCEKHNRSKVMFQFPEILDIEVGDILQEKGARDLWKVTELEDNLHGDVYLNFEVKVEKLSAMSPPKAIAPSQLVIQGSVFGSVQMNSPHASQTVITNVTQISEAVSKLQELTKQSPLTEIDKEEVLLALERIVQLSQKEQTPTVVGKIKEKLDMIKSAFDVGTALGGAVAPWIETIKNAFS